MGKLSSTYMTYQNEIKQKQKDNSMNYKTKVHNLKWTFVTGKGSPKYGKQITSENPQDFEFKASIVVNAEEAKQIQKDINAFWKENKPAKIVKPTSTFLKVEMVDSDEVDEYGAKVKKESGNYLLSASTNAAFKTADGIKPTKVAVLNSKGQPFPESHPLILGEVGVSDESRGVIHGNLAITEYEGKAYVKFYLKGVQFAKFVPYDGSGISVDELESDGDDGSELTADDGSGMDVDGGLTPDL